MKRNNFYLLLVCLLAFILFGAVNMKGSDDAHMLSLLSQDENIQYPYLAHMLEGGDSIFETVKNFVSYQHYFYGYPFYVSSAVLILPVRLIFGVNFVEQVQLNLLLLRQIISVLPMLASIYLLVKMQTAFTSTWKTILLGLFLVTIPGVTRNNLWFWHPDALALFFIVLAIYFLKKDDLKFGKNFIYAAIASGFSAGTKVIGAFFFLAVLTYLFFGLCSKKLPFVVILKKALLFLGIFLLVFVATNPLLLIPETRARILKIQAEQNFFVRFGWQDEDLYETGISAWLPYFSQWYGNSLLLIFLILSLIYAIWKGKNWLFNSLLLAWTIPYTIYLLFFVAVKPFHYPLPIMVPLFSTALNFLPEQISSKDWKEPKTIFTLLSLGFVLFSLISNASSSAAVYQEYFEKEDLLLACHSTSTNDTDGIPVELVQGKWYRLEEFSTTANRTERKFSVIQGSGQVSATEEQGILAWQCTDEQTAIFASSRYAKNFKRSNPLVHVIGPDGEELR